MGSHIQKEHGTQLGGQGLDLAVIVPTFDEVENVEEITERISTALGPLHHEIIFVDDHSPDGTADAVRHLALTRSHVRCLERIGRRGLSSAVIEGIMATSAPVAAVIDGDLQHDETKLVAMLDLLRQSKADMVVGSRYIDGGGFGDWSNRRRRLSELATGLSKRLTGVVLSDPMSGFFMVRTDRFRARVAQLTGVGYKILLDILSAPGPRLEVLEIPYEFRSRQWGESKLDNRVLLEFIELLIARSIGRWLPTKFIMFSMVGAVGVGIHMAVLSSLFASQVMTFAAAQVAATLVAMTANFFVNNFFTYFDRQLHGWQLVPGLLSFCAASAVGALANVGLSVYLFQTLTVPWFGAALAGIVVGATWNYAITALFTWKE